MLAATLVVVPGRALAMSFLAQHSDMSNDQLVDLVTVAALSGVFLTVLLTMFLRPIVRHFIDGS